VSCEYGRGAGLIHTSLANGFSYWQYEPLNNATKTYFYDMAQALGRVQELTGSLDEVHFMNGGMLRSHTEHEAMLTN
jgi:hypothetical protein